MHPFGKNHGKWSSSFGVLADTNFGSSWRMGLPSYCTKSLHKKMTARNHDLSKLTKLDLVAALPHWLSGKAKSAGVLQLGFWPLAPILFCFNHLHAVSASWHCLLNRSQRQRLRRSWWEAQGENPRLLVASQHKSSSRPRCLGKNNSL